MVLCLLLGPPLHAPGVRLRNTLHAESELAGAFAGPAQLRGRHLAAIHEQHVLFLVLRCGAHVHHALKGFVIRLKLHVLHLSSELLILDVADDVGIMLVGHLLQDSRSLFL